MTAGIPASNDPINKAVLDLLINWPLQWVALNTNDMTSAQQKAFYRLVFAGLMELQVHTKSHMHGFPQIAYIRFRVSGKYRLDTLRWHALHAVPGWLTPDGKTRGYWQFEINDVFARLTDEGEIARDDAKNAPARAIWLIKGLAKGVAESVAMELIRVEHTQAGSTGGPNANAVAAARAEAVVGDITINNQIDVPPIQPQIVVNVNGLLAGADGRAQPAATGTTSSVPGDTRAKAKPLEQPSASEPQPGVEKDIPFWIIRLWQGWREANEQRKASGEKPLDPPGSRKVADYLNAHGYKMSHVTAGERLKAAREAGLLDDQWDVTDSRGTNAFDLDEANEEGRIFRDPHGPGQREKRKQERKDRNSDGDWSET